MGLFKKLSKNKKRGRNQHISYGRLDEDGKGRRGRRGPKVRDHRERKPKNPRIRKIAKMPISIEEKPKKPKSLLDDDSKMYKVTPRVMYNEGTPDEPIINQRIKATINSEAKNLEEYGDEFWNSGGGWFTRLKMDLGASNQGKRLFTELRTINNQMGGDFSNQELLEMANEGLKNKGLKYVISSDVLPKEKKFDGGETHMMPDGTEMPGATHEEYIEKQQLPDDEMEDDYMNFIVNEALTEEEENMLMSKLEQDMELSILFDKVVDVAQEFAGSGPVEGPGSGVSDSIPARLSDGEFVFTAKATEEIGGDTLMSMMKEAEAQADERQQVATGGMLDSGEEEIDANTQRKTVVLDRGFVPEEDDLVGDEIKKRMMDPATQSRYVRS